MIYTANLCRPQRPRPESKVAVRRIEPTIEVGRDARAYCARHGARLIAGSCPWCRPPVASAGWVA